MRVLSVAYPFAPVTADPVGGAEQILALIDRALVGAGARSIVLAARGSQVAGELVEAPLPGGLLEGRARERHLAEHGARVGRAIADLRPDVVHFHGVDAFAYLPETGPPAVVTLHLPLDHYPPEALRPRRGVHLVPVSADQARRAPAGAGLGEPIENGIDLDAYPRLPKADHLLCLGRICPEKGFHLALEAARAADRPLILAGSVFPYAAHRRHFREEILPRLDRRRRFVGPVGGSAKRRLLARARAVLVPSLIEETSSLVAREALAAGTPVVAFRRGALTEAVEDGVTGRLVEGPEELAPAIAAAERLRTEVCRLRARRFGAGRMTARYLALYAALAAGPTAPAGVV